MAQKYYLFNIYYYWRVNAKDYVPILSITAFQYYLFNIYYDWCIIGADITHYVHTVAFIAVKYYLHNIHYYCGDNVDFHESPIIYF